MPQATPAEQGVDNPNPVARWLRRLAAPFRRVGRWFAHQPRTVRIGLIVVVLAGLAAGAFFVWSHLKRGAAAHELATAWGEFQQATKKTDFDAAQAALDHVLAVRHDDPTAVRYKAILDRGEADFDTPDLALILLAHYTHTGRLPEATREAEKVLAKFPKHWMARCVVAEHALAIRKDPALAEQHLEQLPDPDDPAANINPEGLYYALRLFAALGRDASGLHQLTVRRLLPILSRGIAASAPPAGKAMLLECYLAAFAESSMLSELAGYWAAADKLADDAVNEAIAAGDVPALTQLAQLGRPMLAALITLRKHDPNRLPDDRVQPMLKAIDDRTRRAWQAVREKAPDHPEVYSGLALLSLRANDPVGAERLIEEGLTACGDRPELLQLLSAVVDVYGSREKILEEADRVWAAAVKAQTDPAKWCLAADVALVVSKHGLHREDFALAACMKAREITPNNPRACSTEARLWIDRGEFFKAREALTPLGETALLTNPSLVQLHARIMVGCGLWILIDDEFKKVTEAQAKLKAKTSVLAVAFVLGVFDAPPNTERAAWVAAKAELILAGDTTAPLAAHLRALSLYRLADLSVVSNPKGGELPPVWNADRVTAALRSFARLTPEERLDPAVISLVAALQLKGEGNAAAALRTINPLLNAEGTLGTAQLEIIGAVLAANDRPADAVRVLERAVKFPKPSAGCFVSLALAYQKNKQPIDAHAALAAAEQIPERSDREQAELIAAKLLFEKERP